MGTTWSLKFTVPQGMDGAALEKGLVEQLELVNQLMSNWQENSDVSRFQRHQDTTPISISPHTARVIQCELDLAQKTDGVFDPTLAPLIDLWGFGAKEKKAFPDQEAIDQALAEIGYHKLALDGHNLSKTEPQLTLNLNAAAKGYSIDLACEYLDAQGVTSYMVEVGGEVRTHVSDNAQRPWRIGINDPANPDKDLAYIVALRNHALATSGDYHNYFMEDGVRYSHIINPKTGRPIPARIASVSIITDNCMEADAYATALMLMDPEKALAMVETIPGMECLIMTREPEGRFGHVMTSGMKAFIQD